jgi:hypothetical protein
MTMSPIHASARLVFLLTLAAITTLMGCASAPERSAADNRPADTKTAAPAPAIQPIAGFSPALRCMDTLLLDYGARDITVTVEDLVDKSNSSGASAKDMLVSAVSDMTQRSRAIRLVAAGKVAPQYMVRGSFNLLDNQSVQRNGANLAASVLGIDLTLLTAQDMSVVPGIATRNSIVLFKQGKGYDGKAEISKFGVTFGLTTTNGVGQASRALVDLASVELFGRLARVPYWTCLGMTEAHPGVSAEIQDWYDAMAAQPSEFVRYFQTQLRARQVYEGPIDGATNPVNAQLKEAVARYREALGLTREPKLSLDFFKAYLAADHHQIEAKLAQSTPTPAQATPVPAPPPPPAAPIAPKAPAADTVMVVSAPAPKGPLALRVGTVNDAQRFGRGEPVQLLIRPSRDAYVYCFLQDENKKIIRFFPNRFQRDSRVQTAEGLRLPGDMRFEITMNPRGVQETISCFATERDVLAQLPAGVNAGDFDPLPINSLEQVRTAFVKVANGGLAHDTFQIQPK